MLMHYYKKWGKNQHFLSLFPNARQNKNVGPAPYKTCENMLDLDLIFYLVSNTQIHKGIHYIAEMAEGSHLML